MDYQNSIDLAISMNDFKNLIYIYLLGKNYPISKKDY